MKRSAMLPHPGTVPSFVRRARAAALLSLAALVAACGGDGRQAGGPTDPTPPREPVAAVRVEPGSVQMDTGATRTLAVRTLAADGTELQGRAVAWSSAAPRVATVDAQGVVKAVGAGETEIRATSEGRTATARVTVAVPQGPPAGQDTVVAYVELSSGPLVALYPTRTAQLIAIPRSASGAVVLNKILTWTTGDERIAWVTDTGGVVAGRVGETTVRAAVDGKWAETTVRVLTRVERVEVQPGSLTLERGESQPLSARIHLLSGAPVATQVAWASENPAVATVDALGRVTAHALGTTYVTATADDKQARIPVTVAEWQTRRLVGTPTSGLPATLYTTTYRGDDGTTHTLRVVATGGEFLMLGGARWEERTSFELYEDGRLVGRQTATDRGTATWGGHWTFVSTQEEGRTFSGYALDGNRLQLEMLLEDGVPPVKLVYSAP